MFSPYRGFKLEEFLRSLDDQGAVTCQDAGTQEEAHIPVTLQLVQAAFFTQQATQLNSCKQDKQFNAGEISLFCSISMWTIGRHAS